MLAGPHLPRLPFLVSLPLRIHSFQCCRTSSKAETWSRCSQLRNFHGSPPQPKFTAWHSTQDPLTLGSQSAVLALPSTRQSSCRDNTHLPRWIPIPWTFPFIHRPPNTLRYPVSCCCLCQDATAQIPPDSRMSPQFFCLEFLSFHASQNTVCHKEAFKSFILTIYNKQKLGTVQVSINRRMAKLWYLQTIK